MHGAVRATGRESGAFPDVGRRKTTAFFPYSRCFGFFVGLATKGVFPKLEHTNRMRIVPF